MPIVTRHRGFLYLEACMDAFAHFIFKSRTTVNIIDMGNGRIRIRVNGSLPNERVAIEVDHLTELGIDSKLRDQLK